MYKAECSFCQWYQLLNFCPELLTKYLSYFFDLKPAQMLSLISNELAYVCVTHDPLAIVETLISHKVQLVVTKIK